MKEHPFPDWPYSYLPYLFIALARVKGQVMLVARVQHHALGVGVFRAPIVNSL